MTAPRARKAPADSFDAFWAEQARSGRTTVIRGVTVPVPADLPLALELRAQELSESTAETDIRELLALLFGVDVLDEWRNKGMGLLELKTVLAWASAQGAGRDISFAEALEAVRAEEAEGKAPSGQNRAARRAAPKKRSASTGGRSARTSAGSTGSARKTSRA
ncbi:hypothetical protein [Streptomyces sp. V1I1]|uniref:hypothetical protein n=1 Tax=Streptomyces sp. V1I1 TaxID=3042272 RepID=UPI00277E497D|nr:hypothetical protein [Streptomyces sp. V1I1]MDQ0943267.1 GNAT superfamily N-acetyltransferase [Streptomyces sp. V1I1]